MPRPRFSEKKQEFVARCISEVRGKEKVSTNEAVARCFKIWEDAEEEKEAADPSKKDRSEE